MSGIFKPLEKGENGKIKENYLLAVSSTNYHKNFHGLIDAFLAANIDIKLKIIGSGAGVFSALNLDRNNPRVEFLGRVDDLELIRLYQNAKAFVFPSLYEGFGIPPLEAQACACPVISSDRASMPEVLGESVLYFDPESKSDMVKSLELICENELLRDKLIAAGLNNVERFSWLNSATKINEIIENS